MRNSSGRTDILSTLLQEMQKPVTKNLMKWKSSVLPVRFVAFSPCVVKVPRSLFSTGCSQQLTERETSQGEPAPLQCSESLPTGLLKQQGWLRDQIQSCSPSEVFSTMQGLYSIHHGEGCVMLQKTGAMALQMLSKGSLMLTAMFWPAQACRDLQCCC